MAFDDTNFSIYPKQHPHTNILLILKLIIKFYIKSN